MAVHAGVSIALAFACAIVIPTMFVGLLYAVPKRIRSKPRNDREHVRKTPANAV